MTWPFLYFPGDRLSTAELAGARLDGDVVELGEAYLPTDAVETAVLRAGSLRRLVVPSLAATRATAAWIHGATWAAPARHQVQRVSATRLHHVLDTRLSYHERRLPADAVTRVGGVWVTTPARTLADLARDLQAGDGDPALIDRMITWSPVVLDTALDLLESGPRTMHKRPALAYLRARRSGLDQDDVTR